jgi:DNA segregation ATPase FtsK/SpoIIIE-like protein
MEPELNPKDFQRLMLEIIDAQSALTDRVIELSRCLRASGYLEETAIKAEEADEELVLQSRFEMAKALVARTQRASIALLQRYLTVDYREALALLERLEMDGCIGARMDNGNHPVYVCFDDVSIPSVTTDEVADGSYLAVDGAIDEVLYEEAKKLVLTERKVSTSFLQQRLNIGYVRASLLLDLLEHNGIIGPQDGNNPREILG